MRVSSVEDSRPPITTIASGQRREQAAGEVITRYPQLVTKQMALVARGAADIYTAVDRILEAHPNGRGLSTTDGSTQTLVSLCYGALQFTTAGAIAGEAVEDLDVLEQQCVDLVRSTIGHIR